MSALPAAAAATASLTHALIEAHWGERGGALQCGGLAVAALAERFGTPLYIYDGDQIVARYRALAAALEGFARVYYSIKANPNPAVARLLVDAGAGLEIASGAEYRLARLAGAAPERILFAGPGKGEHELERVIAAGISEIHLESLEEIAMLGGIASHLGRDVEVAVRINPAASAQGGAMRMGGKATAFGFDEEHVPEVIAALAAQPRLHLTGVHVFAGTQILDAAVLLAQWRHGLDLASALGRRLGAPLRRIDLGGGLGIPYHQGDATLDLTALRQGARELAAQCRQDAMLASAEILIEPGRYLVGPAGLYVTRVSAVKQSRGQRFVVMDGGMHHHLAASGNLGQVIKRDYPIVAATRLDATSTSAATLVGPLCTPLDTLGRTTPLPEVSAGDLVAVMQSGAYGLSASPVGFLSHPMPAEVLVFGGEARLIRAAGTLDAPLVNL